MASVGQIVEELSTAALEPMSLVDKLAEYYAPEVYVRHFPSMPADGMKTRDHVVDLYRAETEVWLQNCPDYRHEDVKVWQAGGDEIQIKLRLCGTIPGQPPFAVPVRFEMKVKDGLIYDAGLEADAKATEPMMDLVVKADMPVELIWDPYAKQG